MYDYQKHKEYQKEYQKSSPKAKEARKRYYKKTYPENREVYYASTQKYRNTWRGRLSITMLGAKYRARDNNLDFDLDIEWMLEQPKVCPVLGIELSIEKDSEPDCSPSLDRVDNDKGYTKVNTRLISRRANRIKNDGTVEEHEKIVQYMKKYAS